MPLTVPQYFFQYIGSGDAGGYNPSSISTYFAGSFPIFDPSTSYASFSLDAQMTTVIRSVVVKTVKAGAESASTNLSTFAVRINDTTDFALGTQPFNVSGTSTFANLSIPINKGDNWAIKWNTPNWSTKPTAIFHSMLVLHEIVGA